MVDLPTATQLLVFGDQDVPVPGSRRLELLAEGAVHVDYDDPEHVFLATVTRVPRVHLLPGDRVVGAVGGVEVRLVDVELANHVTVVLEGAGPVADQLAAEHSAAFRSWTADGVGDRPEWPGRRLMGLPYAVSDDVGTSYRMVSGEAGGEGRPWRQLWRHLPTPPPDARRLHVTFPGRHVVELPLPAW